MFGSPSSVLLAVSAIVIAVGLTAVAVYLVSGRSFGRMSVKAGAHGFEAVLEAVQEVAEKVAQAQEDIQQVNHAVNQVPAGAPTLVVRVASLEEHSHWMRRSLEAIASHVGCALEPFENSTRAPEQTEQLQTP